MSSSPHQGFTRDDTTGALLVSSPAARDITLQGEQTPQTAAPPAITVFPSSNTSRFLHQMDLTGVTQARVVATQQAAASAGTTLAIQYTTDLTGATGWTSLDGAGGPVAAAVTSATGLIVSPWITIAAAAKADVLLRIVTAGGNSTASPAFGRTALQVRGG